MRFVKQKSIIATDRSLTKQIKSTLSNMNDLENQMEEIVQANLEDFNVAESQVIFKGKFHLSGTIDTVENYEASIVNVLSTLSQDDIVIRKHMKLVKLELERDASEMEVEFLVSSEAETNIGSLNVSLTESIAPILLEESTRYTFEDDYDIWIYPSDPNDTDHPMYINCPSQKYAEMLLESHPFLGSNRDSKYNIGTLGSDVVSKLSFIQNDPLYLLGKLYYPLGDEISDRIPNKREV